MHASLPSGSFHGRQLQARRTRSFQVVETAYEPRAELGEHRHDEPYLCVVIAGSFVEEDTHGRFECGPATLVLHGPGDVHADRFGSAGGRCLNVELGSGRFGEAVARRLAERKELHASVTLAWRARALHAGFLTGEDPESLVTELLEELVRGARRARPPAWLALVEERLRLSGPPPSLAELAARCGVHPAHLTRAFRAVHGCSIGQWVRAQRVEAAARDLIEHDLSLAELALRHGFCDQSHFNRVFRDVTRTSPGRYRARARATERAQ